MYTLNYFSLLYCQGNPQAPASQMARHGRAQVLCIVQVQILYLYFRLLVQNRYCPCTLGYFHLRHSLFLEEMHHVKHYRVVVK